MADGGRSSNSGADSAAKRNNKSASAFRTISEVADELDLPQHVLRFWETKFDRIKPMKRAGSRRYYRPDDVELLKRIRDLLHRDGYTIKGVQKLLRAEGRNRKADEPADGALAPDQKAALKSILGELEDLRAQLADAVES